MTYFSIDTFPGWGITPEAGMEEQLKIRSERRLNNFLEWKNPAIIYAFLAHPHNDDGSMQEPDELDDVLEWYVVTNPGGTKLIISEKFKTIMDQFPVAPHWHYNIILNFKGKTYPYIAIIPKLNPADLSFFDFSKTLYQTQKERKPDGIIEDNLIFKDYQHFMERTRELIPQRIALMPKEGKLFLNTDIHLFAESNVFFISEQLKNALEKANLRISFSPLGRYGYIQIKQINAPSLGLT